MEGHDQNSSNLSEEEEIMDLRRGPWTVEEDFTLINYIAHHGEGRWNSLARCAGLKRTGKSCRLRWLNYLRPDVRRGNITLEEQLLILELHSRWGNRWSKIAQHLPGRTDNEIKNYWRTRVQKHAKQLKCDVNSKQFKDTMRYLWMPRLLERIQAAAAAAAAASPLPSSSSSSSATTTTINAPQIMPQQPIHTINIIGLDHHTPDYSSAAAASSESTFGTPVSDLTEYSCYNNHPISGNLQVSNYCADDQYYSLTSPAAPANYFNQGLDFNGGGEWMMDGGDDLWNVDDVWLLHQQFDYNSNV